MEETFPGCRTLISQAMTARSIPQEAMDIMLSSITNTTMRQYNSALKRWWAFCNSHKINLFSAPISKILIFLSDQYTSGMSYGTLNSFRSAISLITTHDVGGNSQVKRFFKGVLNLRPTRPKYNSTWDPVIVLNYLTGLGSNSTISLERLTQKLAILLALTTAQRVQTLYLINIQNIRFDEVGATIRTPDRIKTTGLHTSQPFLHLPFFTENLVLCPAHTLRFY